MRILSADAYDTLEFSALVYKGIGAGPYFEKYDSKGCPNCAYGHAVFASGGEGFVPQSSFVDDALTAAGISPLTTDHAVREINQRKNGRYSNGRYSNARVTFAEWCKELRVVRGK